MSRMESLKAQVTIGMVEMALLRPDRPREGMTPEELDQWLADQWVELLLNSLQYTDTTLEEVVELMDYFKRMQEV